MPRMRNRSEQCPYCQGKREVTINLDTEQVHSLDLPNDCRFTDCVSEVRDKALLSEFEDGKMRVR